MVSNSHPQLQLDEVFLGNTDRQIIPAIAGIVGIRLVQPAYDIYGNTLPDHWAIIATRAAAEEYGQRRAEEIRKLRFGK